MKNFAIFVIALLSVPQLAFAEKKLKTAKVVGYGHGQVVHNLEKVPCKIGLEGILRDRGYRLLEASDTTRPTLLVSTAGLCNQLPGVHAIRGQIVCSIEIKYTFGRRTFRRKFDGTSRASVTSAWTDGCQQARKWFAKTMGAPVNRDGKNTTHKWKKRKITTIFRWSKGLNPMPLLKITGFFKKAGYQAKLLKSGPTSCSFRLSMDQPPEQLADLLHTYLGTKYKISGGYSKGKLRFKLKAR